MLVVSFMERKTREKLQLDLEKKRYCRFRRCMVSLLTLCGSLSLGKEVGFIPGGFSYGRKGLDFNYFPPFGQRCWFAQEVQINQERKKLQLFCLRIRIKHLGPMARTCRGTPALFILNSHQQLVWPSSFPHILWPAFGITIIIFFSNFNYSNKYVVFSYCDFQLHLP